MFFGWHPPYTAGSGDEGGREEGRAVTDWSFDSWGSWANAARFTLDAQQAFRVAMLVEVTIRAALR